MGTLGKTIVIGIFTFFGTSYIFAQQNFTELHDAFRKSYTLEGNGDFQLAINELKTVYQEDTYEINLRLGWLNYMAGSFNESIAFYQKSMELMPYADEPKFGYIFPLTALGRWDEVIAVYNQILENSPHNTKAMYYLGTIYYNRLQYDKAITYFKQIVDLYPFDYDGLLIYAWTKLKLGNKKEAKDLFQKVLLNKPKDASATDGLALASS
ncbi:tetratricopeptide repeat protein [Seonamhaeicola aphaedonensis]|uniref:Anaphase-promoting complex subunit 3 n=1 Tax=Seonamhaeicola aphaedonensis TaxID=1461338 RepID=A0A3D9HM50_9FLAO|nr:tetratricopeptide repeat protein [Seonamhaeicola aphaedonensis]RED50570.1 anaphase-promoting complex subunit 3 [Seonamhaeicola aphaedonensis]